MTDESPNSLFRGTELPRLILLLAVAVAGWVAVGYYATRGPSHDEPPPVVNGKPVPVEPDRSPEFETVTDKTVMGFRDSAAYARLLNQTQDTDPADLASRARRDVHLAQLFESPAKYRGVPIHLLGFARRVLRYESKLSRSGWLYEAWVFTSDGPNFPYVCVFEDAPAGLPVGPNVSERVVFNGYFLKLMRYQAADVPRAAPLLVGRVGWTPQPPAGVTSPFRSYAWLAGGIALMFTISLIRWVMVFRRSLSRAKAPRLGLGLPTEEIDASDLAAWVATESEDADRLRRLGEGAEPETEPGQDAP